MQNKQHVAVIRSAMDVTSGGDPVDGVLSLTKDSQHYIIHWFPRNLRPKASILEILNEHKDYSSNLWSPSSIMNLDCQIVSVVTITIQPIKFTIHRSECQESRSFTVSDNSFDEFSNFVEKLILEGIAVPSPESEYCLFFNRNCRVGFFGTISPDLQLPYGESKEFREFWDSVHQFFIDFMAFIETHYHSPLKNYPLDVGARSCNSLFESKVNKFVATFPKDKVFSVDEYPSLFDEEGRMLDYDGLKKRIYYSGAEQSSISAILPFLVGLYPPDSTYTSREEINKQLKVSYQDLVCQTELIQDYQVTNNKRITCSYRVINHDVYRTDRQHPAFKEQQGIGLILLTKILKSYNSYNPKVNYVQGMNDLFVPILDAFIPSWDEKGNPTDSEGNAVNLDDVEYLMFWCYANFLEMTNHVDFLPLVSEQCRNMSTKVMTLIKDIAPAVAIWFEVRGLSELMWCYTDYVLLFKRSFEQIWPIWINIITAPDPCEWIAHFAGALIIYSFNELSKMPNAAITDVLSAFPVIIQRIDKDSLLKMADYISSLCTKKLTPPHKEEKDDFVSEFFPNFL